MSSTYDNIRCIHINIDKEALQQLRIKLYKLELNTQDVFTEIIQKIVLGEPLFERMLENMRHRKLKLALKKVNHKIMPVYGGQVPSSKRCELDTEKVYDMINDDSVDVDDHD